MWWLGLGRRRALHATELIILGGFFLVCFLFCLAYNFVAGVKRERGSKKGRVIVLPVASRRKVRGPDCLGNNAQPTLPCWRGKRRRRERGGGDALGKADLGAKSTAAEFLCL